MFTFLTKYVFVFGSRLFVPAYDRAAFAARLHSRGDGEIRTLDPLLARQVLSQLSYTPSFGLFPKPQQSFPPWIP